MKDLILGVLLGALLMLGGLFYTGKAKADLPTAYVALHGPFQGDVLGTQVYHYNLDKLIRLMELSFEDAQAAGQLWNEMIRLEDSHIVNPGYISVKNCNFYLPGFTICEVAR